MSYAARPHARRSSREGIITEGFICPPRVAVKVLERVDKPPVGTHLLMTATGDIEGVLRGALARSEALVGLETLHNNSGAEITIDHDQVGGGAQVLEATIGECNDKERNFHEAGADVHTARVHRALRAAVPCGCHPPTTRFSRRTARTVGVNKQ